MVADCLGSSTAVIAQRLVAEHLGAERLGAECLGAEGLVAERPESVACASGAYICDSGGWKRPFVDPIIFIFEQVNKASNKIKSTFVYKL